MQAAEAQPQFDCKSVLAHYNQIQYGKTKEEKAAANQFIVQLMASE